MARRSARPPLVPSTASCPCGLDASYATCCGRFHRGSAAPTTAEQLMRSRYAAFVVRDADYLLRTWSPASRPSTLEFDEGLRWAGLHVLTVTGGSAFHTEGTVEFRARYGRDGEPGELHETSRFVRDGGQWVYHGARA